ncbi:MAG TPA: hypothetical protein VIQ03_08430 [Gammaproteobacteria bacterium]
MKNDIYGGNQPAYYFGPERRHANKPRRYHNERRHRIRDEALLSDCRTGMARRKEDEEGFFEISNLYNNS